MSARWHCPLISKAARSADSGPRGPAVKFNGLRAMTSKSLCVQPSQTVHWIWTFPPLPAPRRIMHHRHNSARVQCETQRGKALAMQTPWLSGERKQRFFNEVTIRPVTQGREGTDTDVYQKPLFDADSIKKSCVTSEMITLFSYLFMSSSNFHRKE